MERPPEGILNCSPGEQPEGNTLEWRQVRLFLVGDGGAGKTTVLRWLQGLPFQPLYNPTDGAELATLDINSWQSVQGLNLSGELLARSTGPSPMARSIFYVQAWDFAGQEVYYNIHRVFFKDRAIYLLVVNFAQPIDQIRSSVLGWLKTIRGRSESSSIRIVGTRAHEPNFEVISSLQQLIQSSQFTLRSVHDYPSVEADSIWAVDCKSNLHRDTIRDRLHQLASMEPLQRCPMKWLHWHDVCSQKAGMRLQLQWITYEEAEHVALECQMDHRELSKAVAFFDSLGLSLRLAEPAEGHSTNPNDTRHSGYIFLNMQSVVAALRTVITVRHRLLPFDRRMVSTQQLDNLWPKLVQGRISSNLLTAIWSMRLRQQNKAALSDDANSVTLLRQLLEAFDLALPDPLQTDIHDQGQRDLLVPCLVNDDDPRVRDQRLRVQQKLGVPKIVCSYSMKNTSSLGLRSRIIVRLLRLAGPSTALPAATLHGRSVARIEVEICMWSTGCAFTMEDTWVSAEVLSSEKVSLRLQRPHADTESAWTKWVRVMATLLEELNAIVNDQGARESHIEVNCIQCAQLTPLQFPWHVFTVNLLYCSLCRDGAKAFPALPNLMAVTIREEGGTRVVCVGEEYDYYALPNIPLATIGDLKNFLMKEGPLQEKSLVAYNELKRILPQDSASITLVRYIAPSQRQSPLPS